MSRRIIYQTFCAVALLKYMHGIILWRAKMARQYFPHVAISQTFYWLKMNSYVVCIRVTLFLRYDTIR